MMTPHILLTPPRQEADARQLGLTLGRMAGRLTPEGALQLCRTDGPGGWLLVGCDCSPAGSADPGQLVRALVSACLEGQRAGIILDLETPPTPFLAQVIRGLDGSLARRGLGLFLPERYGRFSDRAGLYFSSALSGGSLARRLQDAAAAFGPQRLALSLHRAAEDFFLPAPSGSGKPLSAQALGEMLRRMDPATFFSPQLCARYFTYMDRRTGAHFVLYDTAETLRRKQALARKAGICQFFWLYPQVRDLLPQALLPAEESV